MIPKMLCVIKQDFFRGFIFLGMVMNYGDFEIKKNKIGTKGSWTTTVLCKL